MGRIYFGANVDEVATNQLLRSAGLKADTLRFMLAAEDQMLLTKSTRRTFFHTFLTLSLHSAIKLMKQ